MSAVEMSVSPDVAAPSPRGRLDHLLFAPLPFNKSLHGAALQLQTEELPGGVEFFTAGGRFFSARRMSERKSSVQ